MRDKLNKNMNDIIYKFYAISMNMVASSKTILRPI